MFICIACYPIKHFKCKQYYQEHPAQYHSSSSKYNSNCNLHFQQKTCLLLPCKKKVLSWKYENMTLYCDMFVGDCFNENMIFFVIFCLNVSNLLGLVAKQWLVQRPKFVFGIPWKITSWIYEFMNDIFPLVFTANNMSNNTAWSRNC